MLSSSVNEDSPLISAAKGVSTLIVVLREGPEAMRINSHYLVSAENVRRFGTVKKAPRDSQSRRSPFAHYPSASLQ